MYKRLTIPQLLGIQTDFFTRIQTICKKERCNFLKEFLKVVLKDGTDVYFLREGNGFFRVARKPDGMIFFTDEVEKIELPLDEDGVNELHNLLKWDKKVQRMMKDNQSISETLEAEYASEEWRTFMDKPYIVYDIETTWTTNDLKSHHISVGYMFDSLTGAYKLIDQSNVQKVVDHMVAYDGYIVGFYNIGFDNPVMLHNSIFDQEQLDIINKKSIDICFFVQNILKKRMGLNKLSEALVGAKKTLADGGLEGARLYKEYLEDGDTKKLNAVKKYCKQDVHMTHLVFLYLLKYQNLFDEGNEVHFTHDDILTLSHNRGGDNAVPTVLQDSMFAS
jgi:uncharacterized protein YprB with RNaseH-like and TPR domain